MQGKSEVEITLYAKVSDFDGLQQADEVEEHIQLEARTLNGDKIRIRKTTVKGGRPVYVFTAKQKNRAVEDQQDGIADVTEYDAAVTEEMFQVFEKIMEQKIVKTRYRFKNTCLIKATGQSEPIPVSLDNMGYEVDVFETYGSPCKWVKIDIEIDALSEYLAKEHPDVKEYKLQVKVSHLPFKPIDIIFPSTADEAQKAFIENLWRSQFAMSRSVIK